MRVDELAEQIGQPAAQVIKLFFELGEMVTINQLISFELAEIVCEHQGLKAERQSEDIGALYSNVASGVETEQDIRPRSAIVTIMGAC